MSSVGAVNGSTPFYSIDGTQTPGINYANLTPDALLAYCSTQLKGIDTQVNDYMQQQNTQLAQKNAIQTATQAMNALLPNGPASGATGWQQIHDCEDKIMAAAQQLPEGDPVRAQMITQCQAMAAQYPTSGNKDDFSQPGNGPWTATIGGFTNLATNVGSEQSIGMIQIQSLVSQRQTAVQLTTNMMATIDQTQQQIAGKIGG